MTNLYNKRLKNQKVSTSIRLLISAIIETIYYKIKDNFSFPETCIQEKFETLLVLYVAGKNNSTGNLSSDLRTWLSAALANQDTCMDGFDGTNGIVKGLVSSGLGQITSLLQQLLTQVNPISNNFPFSSTQGHFPSWVKPGDRKLLQANGVVMDAVVSADGTGDFTKVMDAVLAAPNYSMKRYVIFVKRGVYHENVEIKKKKWNLMMIGEGMNATVITGNRSFVDGWTTFRSATFGKNTPHGLHILVSRM